MPKSCPACGRPNADRASQCLYCTAPLEPLENAAPETSAEEIPTLPQAPASDRHLIILAPQPDASVTDGRVEAFAAAAAHVPVVNPVRRLVTFFIHQFFYYQFRRDQFHYPAAGLVYC